MIDSLCRERTANLIFAAMPWFLLPTFLPVIILVSTVQAHAETRASIGLGIRYWQTVGSIDRDDRNLRENGVTGVLLSLEAQKGLFKLQLEGELASKDFGGTEEQLVTYQIYTLLGDVIYAGVGVGIGLWCENNIGDATEPFVGARAGFQLPTPWPRISLDLNGTYLVNAFDELGDDETDAFMLGAVLRYEVGREE